MARNIHLPYHLFQFLSIYIFCNHLCVKNKQTNWQKKKTPHNSPGTKLAPVFDHLAVSLSVFPAPISGSKCHMVLSVLPLLYPTRHQTQISYLGYRPGRQAHTCKDRLTHTHTHTGFNCKPVNNKTPSVS